MKNKELDTSNALTNS